MQQPEEVGSAMGATAVDVKLRPLGDRVLIRPLGREETTKSGIVLPDTAKEKPQRGIVVAVGAGRVDDDGDRIAVDVEVGDEVLFAKYAGTEFKLDEDEFLILAEKDILAVIG
jgi:chaperonin GroES